MRAVLLALSACSVPEPPAALAAPIVPATTGRVRLALIGDTGTGQEAQWQVQGALASACAARGCDAVVLLGDVLYPAGMETDDPDIPDARIASYRHIAPVYVVLGNHEYGRGRAVANADRLVRWAGSTHDVHLPSRSWNADFPGGTLIALDTQSVFINGVAGQGPWLQAALDAEPGWRIVVGHHPMLSSGRHGSAGAYEGWSWIPWVSGRSLRQLFERHLCGRADLYVAGHDHHLEVGEACGLTWVVSGAGATVRPLEQRGHTPLFASSELGFVHLDLGRDTAELTVISADGRTLDVRQVNKGLRTGP